ncbi:hypothetical protein BI49514_01639 [Brevibacterium iodinum ATCC 49514]|uniref:Uncharacterized protein n=2 Tax=Brevibacterium TaxID=1696 RepID=A0A2H1J582_9MICO|nr:MULTISPECIES: hypothetical protein [Brevibacterium]UVI36412.1 hypothetical protein L1F31_01730 [Brevibacterium spongiae]SMX82667.1 hypothetical protein BI49514_01639 [Brevibacterium iodinum ATCC 49514]SUW14303.1 Uncharacterised protein [Brevibacterium iodinum]
MEHERIGASDRNHGQYDSFIFVFPNLDIPDADRERFIAFIKDVAAAEEG